MTHGCARDDGSSKLAELPELGLYLSEERCRKLPQQPAEATIIDGPALVDHHLTVP